MKTELGSFLRQLRIKNQQILKDMAEILGVSSAFLSAVENGKKCMPESWYEKLRNNYELNEYEMDKLEYANMLSQHSLSLNLENASESARHLAVSFARCFDKIDADTNEQIMEMLNKWNREP